jgi:hypothetical protein
MAADTATRSTMAMVLPKMIHFSGTDLGIFGPLLAVPLLRLDFLSLTRSCRRTDPLSAASHAVRRDRRLPI